MNGRISDTIRKLTRRKTARTNIENLQVPQTNESPVLSVLGDEYSFRYAYARSTDTKNAAEPGQDYLTICANQSYIAFALCDGVSQSYYGELASQFIGEVLLNWLKFSLPNTMDVTLLKKLLSTTLEEATGPASAMIDRHQIPSHLPELLRSVLHDKKKLGSESTFVCCRADFPGTQYPMGRAVFAWLGDSRLRIWDSEAEISEELPGEFDTMQRWSTRRGQLGSAVHTYVRPLQGHYGIRRITAYSDGLATLDNNDRLLTNWDIQKLIQEAGDAPTSDDISFMEIFFEPWKSRVEGHLNTPPGKSPKQNRT